MKISKYLLLLMAFCLVSAARGEIDLLESDCKKSKYGLEKYEVGGELAEALIFDVHRVVPKNKNSTSSLLLLHEIDGLGCETGRLAHYLANRTGMDVYLPSFYGEPLEAPGLLSKIWIWTSLSFSPNWSTVFNADSKVVDQLDLLVTHIHSQTDSKVGVLGMCLTGGFPVALSTNPHVALGIVSQPALPFLAFGMESRLGSLGISEERMSQVIQKNDVPILGLRYALDPLSPPEKFHRLKKDLGSNFFDCTISTDELPDQQDEIEWHSVLTGSKPKEDRENIAVDFIKTHLLGEEHAARHECQERTES